MIGTLVTVLFVGIGLAGIVTGLQRNHVRTTGLAPRMFGSAVAEDRDITRVRAELDAAGSGRISDLRGDADRTAFPSTAHVLNVQRTESTMCE